MRWPFNSSLKKRTAGSVAKRKVRGFRPAAAAAAVSEEGTSHQVTVQQVGGNIGPGGRQWANSHGPGRTTSAALPSRKRNNNFVGCLFLLLATICCVFGYDCLRLSVELIHGAEAIGCRENRPGTEGGGCGFGESDSRNFVIRRDHDVVMM